MQLNKTRDVGMQVAAIKHVEITAWAQGMGINLLPFERRAICAIDDAFMAHQNSKSKETK